MLRLLFISVLGISLFLCCTSPSDSNDSRTLTIKFENSWLCASCGEGILFYSDLSGTTLWSGSWSGNDTLQVDAKDFPDRVSITTVTQDKNYYNRINITTNYNIDPASWIFRGRQDFEYLGSATLNFSNIPEHQGYIVASINHRRGSTGGQLSATMDKYLYKTPDDIFIRINTLDGPGYMIIEDVSVDDTRNIDLAPLQPLSSKVINLATSGEDIYFNLRGYFNQDYYSGYCEIDYAYGYNYNTNANTYTTYFPTGIFPQYYTNVYINEESAPTYNYWRHRVLGNIPDALVKINADFGFISTNPTSFEIDASGDYHQVNSYWSYENGGDRAFSWSVHTTMQKYALPQLPTLVTEKYPDISRGLFSLTSVNIQKHIGLQSYDELIDNMFYQGKYYFNFVNGSLARSKDPEGLR